jgi:biopolymer transport protein ExbD
MKIRRGPPTLDKIELQMTPMIDIVFQLNIFFLLTFKIILPEGDFNIRMPSAASARAVDPSESLPMTVVMKAGPGGVLADLQIDRRSLGTGDDAFARLRQYVREQVNLAAGGPGTAPDQEVELDCDYDLQYHYVIRAMDAVTGYIENNQRHKLVERIKFTPPEK